MKNKNISIWFNRYGVDECYGKLKGEWNKELWGKIEKMIDWCEGVKFKEFEEEFKGEGWVMYGWDGVGVFVVDEGYDVDKCKDEYDVILNDGEICIGVFVVDEGYDVDKCKNEYDVKYDI